MYLIRATSPDLVIPMPSGGDLPAEGAIVPALDLYWVRRTADRSVIATEVAAETVAEAIAEIAGRAADKKKG